MRTAYELQALTRASPTSSPPAASAYLDLADLRGHRLVVEAPAGCLLGGAGSMRAYLKHRTTGNWLRAPDFDVQVSATGAQGQAFADVEAIVQVADAAFYGSDGVTLSGTATNPAEADKLKVYLCGESHR